MSRLCHVQWVVIEVGLLAMSENLPLQSQVGLKQIVSGCVKHAVNAKW